MVYLQELCQQGGWVFGLRVILMLVLDALEQGMKFKKGTLRELLYYPRISKAVLRYRVAYYIDLCRNSFEKGS